jgi:hypothetical protein
MTTVDEPTRGRELRRVVGASLAIIVDGGKHVVY